MTDPSETTRPLPEPIDLGSIDPTHPDPESPEHLVGVAAAETARAVTGVYTLGGAIARTLDQAGRRILGATVTPGVTVSIDGDTTVIDLELVADYPAPINDVVTETRDQVSRAAQQLVSGLIIVNIDVIDVHGPFDNVPQPEGERSSIPDPEVAGDSATS